MRGPLLVLLVAAAACDRGPLAERAKSRQRSLGAQPADVRPAPEPPARFGVGRAPSDSQLAAWDVDVSPNGAGLPQGRGSVTQGATVYALKCSSCHGADGEGTITGPMLVGRAPADSFRFGEDPKLVKTVGNYWPYATTLFDYVRRAMPINAPGSLTNSEVYAVVAFLLARNGVIEATAVMDSASLSAVKMPALDKFVPDDRKGGPGFR